MSKINNKILSIYDKIVLFFSKIKSKTWFKPVLGLSIFIIVFLFFFLFTYTHPIYEGVFYQQGNATKVGESMAAAYKSWLGTFDTNYILIIGISLIIAVGIIYIYLLINKRNNFMLGIIVLFAVALIIRLTYTGYCDAIFKNQHDVWSNNNTGH